MSFNHPPINSKKDWDDFIHKVLENGEKFSELVANLPSEKLMEPFVDEKYGIYYRNLHGAIEHFHYHLGQIVILKKLIRNA